MPPLPALPRLLSSAPVAALFEAWGSASPPAAASIRRLRTSNHGDLPRWLGCLAALPAATPSTVQMGEAITVGDPRDLTALDRQRLATALRGLLPWRKGPFALFGLDIDAEWRADRKWGRIAPHLELGGKRVLDVGCGNGYYGWRMRAAGAESVTGVDPSLLAVLQHAAMAYYAGAAGFAGNLVLPLRLQDLPPTTPFDVVASLGVVYHRRDGAEHVRALARHAHRASVLVLESLVVDGEPLRPKDRYARMRNVHLIPNVELLRGWLAAAGFRRTEVVAVAATTTAEQRATPWMPFESLAQALAPDDPARTVEGYPAPRRAAIVARR